MGLIATALAALTVSAESPDQNLYGELTGRGMLTIHFNASGIDDYTTGSQLAAQVSTLISDLLQAKREAQYSKISELTELTVDHRPHWNSTVQNFRKSRDELKAIGESGTGSITISSVGMLHTDVAITPGAFNELDSAAFLFEVRSAFADLQTDWAEALQVVKSELLGSARNVSS